MRDNHRLTAQLWKVDADAENRRVEYLATLTKHTQAVNVVRWSPKSELLASAGDDGNVILWVPAESSSSSAVASFGSDASLDDKETWRTKHMCRSSGAEIYDLAWSPDGMYFIIGSMDNIARIYNAATGSLVRQIAEHSHYVQGVAWDPLNEYIATQSSDRSVHIYSLKTKDGQYTLSNGLGGGGSGSGGSVDDKTGAAPSKVASHAKADLPPRRLASQSPAPSDIGAPLTAASLSASLAAASHRSQLAAIESAAASTGPASMSSPVPSAPGTPTSFALPMNPPSAISHSHSHSRRSSFSSSRRSVSPAPSMPLPAVMPMEASPKPPTSMGVGGLGLGVGLSVKNASLYANETLTSFFRRLTFTPDGSLLLTPAGQYQTQHQAEGAAKPSYEITNTVYIYSRGGINKAPIAHLPGHKKPSVAVRCSPTIYTLRPSPSATKHITIDTSSAEDPIPALPEPLTSSVSARPTASPSVPSTPSVMDPPPPPTPKNERDASTTPTLATASMATTADTAPAAPKSAFALSHRMIYAVATQDSVLLYDTQQQTPICVVSNLHCATFTDLAWASDGLTLLISSSDGFCSTLSFAPGELGQPFTGELPSSSASASGSGSASAAASAAPSTLLRHHRNSASASSLSAPSPPVSSVCYVSSVSSAPPPLLAPTPVSIPASTTASFMSARPSSPARSNSASSIITQASMAPAASQSASQSANQSASQSAASQPGMNNPQLVVGAVPSLSASGSLKALQAQAAAAASVGQTPPQTPRNRANSAASSASVAGSVVGVPPAISAVPASAAASTAASTAAVPAKRDASDDKDKDEQAPKKRRIAPTLVSSLEGES